jgi:hypothetical protein
MQTHQVMTQKIIPYGPITLLISNKSDNIHVMTRKFLGLVFYSATLLMGVVAIESSCSQATTDWGPNFGGIQLSIELSTNTVTAGSEVIFFMRIKNSSSDIARLNNEETKLIVTNSSGKAYQLIKGFNVYNPKVKLNFTRQP